MFLWDAISLAILTTVIVGTKIDNLEIGPTIKIKSGKIKGIVLKSHNGRDFDAFVSIPFAKSTAGLGRFKPPELVDSWDGIYDATKLDPVQCPQIDIVTKQPSGTEDCLKINVYRPQVSKSKSQQDGVLPVLVFIYGGGFAYGSASYSTYGPQKFMDNDVILVTFNYRVGIFGFFNSEDSASPGNYGMLDQALALRWVKENIACFGGNPELITIFGESAGAASVVYHMISPLSKGLFTSAIAQSGSALNPWAFQRKPLAWAKKLAKEVQCPTNVTQNIFDCFRKSSVEKLLKGSKRLLKTAELPSYPAPSIEGPGGKGFLTDYPETLIKEQKIHRVPFYSGIDKDEGYYFYSDLSKTFKTEGKAFLEKDLANFLSASLNVDPGVQNLEKAIKKEYFENLEDGDSDVIKQKTIEMLSDCIINAGVVRTIDLFAKARIPTFAYLYTHRSPLSYIVLDGGEPGPYVTHGDELLLQFQLPDQTMNFNDTAMSRQINSLWTRIALQKELRIADDAKTYWKPYNTKEPSYLNICLKPLIEKGKLCDKDHFWINIAPKLIDEFIGGTYPICKRNRFSNIISSTLYTFE